MALQAGPGFEMDASLQSRIIFSYAHVCFVIWSFLTRIVILLSDQQVQKFLCSWFWQRIPKANIEHNSWCAYCDMQAVRQMYVGNAGIGAQIIWCPVGVVITWLLGMVHRVFWDSGIGGDWDWIGQNNQSTLNCAGLASKMAGTIWYIGTLPG